MFVFLANGKHIVLIFVRSIV